MGWWRVEGMGSAFTSLLCYGAGELPAKVRGALGHWNEGVAGGVVLDGLTGIPSGFLRLSGLRSETWGHPVTARYFIEDFISVTGLGWCV